MTRPHDDDPDRDPPGDAGESGDSHDELKPDEVDQRFAELIAGLKDESPQWPEDDEVDDAEAAARRAHPSAAASTAEEEEPSLLELWDNDNDDDDSEEDEPYRPPPAPPIPVPSLPAIMGLLLIIGGLVLIVTPDILDVGQGLGRFTGIAAFAGGVVTLIWRLRPEPDEDDDDPGNGAVV